MNLRLLSIAVILALASASVPLRGGKFATETDLLYTVQEVNERERFYFEAELGCNLQCTNHCIEVQEGNALANCINYCGCSALMSAQPLSAYKLDVYYPDGSAQTFNVNEPGNDFALVFTNPDENSLGVSKVDYVDPSNDFTVVVGEENKGRTSSQYAGFQGSQPEEFAYLTHETTEVPNGWDEKTSFGTTEFNYDVSSQGRVKESKNQVDFTYNETGVGSDGHGFNTQFQATGKDKKGGASSLSAGLEFNNWLQENALNAYRVDVYLPDGSKQTFNVNDPNDTSDKVLNVSTPNKNSFEVQYTDQLHEKNNFTLSGEGGQRRNSGSGELNYKSEKESFRVYSGVNESKNTVSQRAGVDYSKKNGYRYTFQENQTFVDHGRNPDGTNSYSFVESASDSEGHGKTVNLDFDLGEKRGRADLSGEFDVTAWIDTTGLQQLPEKSESSFSSALWYAVLLTGLIAAGFFGARKLIEDKAFNSESRSRLVVYNDI